MATWVGYPKSYTKGRLRPLQLMVWHATAGSEGPSSAENGAAYDKRRTDGTSTNMFVDTDTALVEVPTKDRAHHARAHGNEIGYGIELCGQASQSNAQWHDAYSWPMLVLAAREVAAVMLSLGWTAADARWLSVVEVRAAYYAPAAQRPRGMCTHWDITRAFPEDQGSHTDPGNGFPKDEVLAMVKAAMGAPTGGATMARFTFQGFPDEGLYGPAKPGGPSRVHQTVEGVRYLQQQYSATADKLKTQAGFGPIVNLTPANTGYPTYAVAVRVYCGREDPGEYVAPVTPPDSGGAGGEGLTVAQVEAIVVATINRTGLQVAPVGGQ